MLEEKGEFLSLINKEKQDFEDKDIQRVPGLLFNQRKMIEQIYFYYNSKFQTGDIDTEGDRKYFFNINKNPCKLTTKAIDFDTKHIQLLTAGGGNALKTWFMERDLKHWMKDKQFGKVLNRIFKELPIFGSVVLKIIKGVPLFIDLRNFIIEQSADSLDEANYIIERHPYTVPNFRKAAKDIGWKQSKVDETIKLFREMKDVSHIMVYERYGEVLEKGKWEYRRVCLADVGIDEEDARSGISTPYKGVELSSDVMEHPYWEFHLDKLPGRWLGVGDVETLIEPQIRQNEIANLQAKGSAWAALQLFQSSDPATNRYLMIDAQNGDILSVESPITKVDISDRNLSFFTQEFQKWMGNRDELVFSYDVLQGDTLPAGTPLGSARLAAGMASSHFDQIQENQALTVKELLYEVIIPQFEKQTTPEHTLRLAGEDLDKVNDMMIKQQSKNALFDFLKKKAKLPTKEQYEAITAAIEQRVKQGKEKLLTIPKGFYNGVKYALDIVITGESKDTSVWAQTMFAGLQAVTVDPTILTDPVKKKFFAKFLEAGGASIVDFVPDVQTSGTDNLMPVKSVGGGVARPAPATGGGTATQTL